MSGRFEACTSSNCTATLAEALAIAWSPRKHHIAMSGSVGLGYDFSTLPALLPSLLLAVIIYGVRESLKGPLMSFGRKMGVKGKKTLLKFQNQGWLAIFYICSTAFGYFTLRDEPYFKLPVRASSGDGAAYALWAGFPHQPKWLIMFYYNYAVAFYLTELTTLFVYGKRTDFVEMFAHHIFTLTLLVTSHVGYYHRLGAYILFIHDASDIMLCVAKMISYCNTYDWITNVGFLGFVSTFVYFRLYVFPMLIPVNFGVAPKVSPFSYGVWFSLLTLHILLQSLHIYWFTLILRVAGRTFHLIPAPEGKRTKDVRSSDDEHVEAVNGSKATKHEHKPKHG